MPLSKTNLLLLISSANYVHGAFLQSSQKSFVSLEGRRTVDFAATSPLSPLFAQTDDNDDHEDEFLLEVLSPMQVKSLRKEISKRKATSNLPNHNIPQSEDSDYVTDETLDSILTLFDSSELVEVRGISRNQKKHVFSTSEDLAMTLSSMVGKTVHRVETKGFASTYYCAWDEEEEREGRIILRTSAGQKNTWVKKPKALRDHRGQIIPGSKPSLA